MFFFQNIMPCYVFLYMENQLSLIPIFTIFRTILHPPKCVISSIFFRSLKISSHQHLGNEKRKKIRSSVSREKIKIHILSFPCGSFERHILKLEVFYPKFYPRKRNHTSLYPTYPVLIILIKSAALYGNKIMILGGQRRE